MDTQHENEAARAPPRRNQGGVRNSTHFRSACNSDLPQLLWGVSNGRGAVSTTGHVQECSQCLCSKFFQTGSNANKKWVFIGTRLAPCLYVTQCCAELARAGLTARLSAETPQAVVCCKNCEELTSGRRSARRPWLGTAVSLFGALGFGAISCYWAAREAAGAGSDT